jgi:hypothetical protein
MSNESFTAHLLSMRPEGVESKNAIGARKTACSMLSKNAFAVVSPEKAINVDLQSQNVDAASSEKQVLDLPSQRCDIK